MKNQYVKLFIYTLLGSFCLFMGEIQAQVDKNLMAYNDNTTVLSQKPINFDLSVFKNNLTHFQPRKVLKDTNSVLEQLVNNLNIDGQVRFSTIYRNMSQAYADMTTSNQNVSFVDYPISNSGAAQLAGYPMLELRFGSRFSKNIDFNVGYSFFHSFTGATDINGGKSLTVVNNLKFNGNVLTPIGKFTINAGAGLTAALSRFTVGLPQNRDDYFDRLPWDWYRKSFTRYEDYYNLSTNVGSSTIGRAQFQGFTLNGNILPLDLNVTALVGRTNYTVSNSNTLTNFPALIYGGRVEKPVFTRTVNGKFGVNYYERRGYISAASDVLDANNMITLDMSAKIKKIIFSAEIAGGSINNPLLRTTFENDVFKNGSGLGFFVKADVDKKLSTLPFGAEFYYIGKNLVSLDGGIVNSNTNVRVGGYQVPDPAKPNEFNVYDNLLLEGLAQEVGILANNRMGLNLKAEKKIGKFSVQLSTGISQEIENNSNVINIQHRVNAFSSSRFRPWFQAAGPYSRIRSNYRRTYETFTVNDASTDYKKGFNTFDIFLKFRTKLFGKELMLFNFSNFSSTQQGIAALPLLNDKAFVRSFYNAFDVAYKLSPKYSVVAQYGVERVLGNNRIDMVQNDGTTVTTDKNDPKGAKTVNQLGQSLGFGIDYDFAPTAGLHLRHKFMWHEDQNFVLDKYVGQETYLELKIFFQ